MATPARWNVRDKALISSRNFWKIKDVPVVSDSCFKDLHRFWCCHELPAWMFVWFCLASPALLSTFRPANAEILPGNMCNTPNMQFAFGSWFGDPWPWRCGRRCLWRRIYHQRQCQEPNKRPGYAGIQSIGFEKHLAKKHSLQEQALITLDLLNLLFESFWNGRGSLVEQGRDWQGHDLGVGLSSDAVSRFSDAFSFLWRSSPVIALLLRLGIKQHQAKSGKVLGIKPSWTCWTLQVCSTSYGDTCEAVWVCVWRHLLEGFEKTYNLPIATCLSTQHDAKHENHRNKGQQKVGHSHLSNFVDSRIEYADAHVTLGEMPIQKH